MARRRPNLPLLAGICFSLLLHGAAILPMMMAAMGASMESVVMRGRFDPDDFRKPPAEDEEQTPEEPRNEVELGIDEKTPSTLTWVGHDHYEEHLARIAEVEQAAFTDRAAPPGEADADTVSPPTTPAAEAQPSTPAEVAEASEPPAEAAPPNEPVELAEAAPPPSEIESDEQPTTPAEAPDAVPTPAVAPRLLALAPPDAPVAPVGNQEEPEDPTPGAASPPPPTIALERPTPDETKDAEAETEPEPEKQTETEPKPEAKPVPQPTPSPPVTAAPNSSQPPAPGAKDPQQGDPSPKESDATSIKEVPIDQLKLGKPIARQGLELMPRRPRFTTLTKITAAPGNPLIEIRFDRAGRPKKALILQTSGDARIDHAIEASLYRWRARGRKLLELGPKETANIQLRIVLNPRRR